ncbi:SPOR domain-containing protein [Sphingomonas sp. LaA6.9]|uniref:SPOR domain-containing protein n=1 Tax=Sphingomonas sp. LaA6.9 TaxID=2919914 RepID=UPI001F4F7E7B|nr:SPOR domain-containing protein [Sphingomonas sp. LaA6.9]MCJ8159201.1 SPOR domain-containing protein [Sphingomonas sp. LaA6.9]
MSDYGRGGLDLRDEDRLPWLEAVEDVGEDRPAVSSMKLVGGVVAALAALGIVIAGVSWVRNRDSGTEGDGSLIQAPAGDYKVKPEAPGGMKVEGQGDASFATSEGAEATGKIDTAALPEAPVQGQVVKEPAQRTERAAAPVATVKVAEGGRLPAPAPAKSSMPLPVGVGPGGSLIQLGAYGNEALANAAWTRMSKRFQFIADLPRTIVPVKVGENTLYRLRVNAGSSGQAAELCGKLKVAGENCLIAAN